MNIIYKKSRSKGLIFLAIFFFIFIPIILVLSLVSKYNLSASQLIVPILILFIIFLTFTILILKNNNDLFVTEDGVIHFKNNHIRLSDVRNIQPVQEYQYKTEFNTKTQDINSEKIIWKDRDKTIGIGHEFAVYAILNNDTEYNLGYMTESEINELDSVISNKFGRNLVN